MNDPVDAREVMLWLAEHPVKGSQSAAAKHFHLTRGRISQIIAANKEGSRSLNKARQGTIQQKDAVIEIKQATARDGIEKALSDLDEANQIFKGLVGEAITARKLDSAVSAARGLRESIEAQGKIILTLKGLIGNTLVDARSIHVHALADLPPGAREAIEREVATKVITEAWGALCPECRAKLSGGK